MLAVVPNGKFHPGFPIGTDDELRRIADEYWLKISLPWLQQRTAVFRQMAPDATIIGIESPEHRIYLAAEDDTLQAMDEFLVSLPG
jgi:hypothetical protein